MPQRTDDYAHSIAKWFGLCLLFALFAILVMHACTRLYDHILEDNRKNQYKIRSGSGYGAASGAPR